MITFLICLLFFCPAPEPKCPPLHPVMKKHWVEVGKWQKTSIGIKNISGDTVYLMFATTTFIDGKPYVLDGYATDTEAIAYNKRVEECRTLNGEF